MRRFLHILTGGRPMRYEGFLFTDIIVNKAVNSYTDYFGRRWMAHGAWSWFRVERD